MVFALLRLLPFWVEFNNQKLLDILFQSAVRLLAICRHAWTKTITPLCHSTTSNLFELIMNDVSCKTAMLHLIHSNPWVSVPPYSLKLYSIFTPSLIWCRVLLFSQWFSESHLLAETLSLMFVNWFFSSLDYSSDSGKFGRKRNSLMIQMLNLHLNGLDQP